MVMDILTKIERILSGIDAVHKRAAREERLNVAEEKKALLSFCERTGRDRDLCKGLANSLLKNYELIAHLQREGTEEGDLEGAANATAETEGLLNQINRMNIEPSTLVFISKRLKKAQEELSFHRTRLSQELISNLSTAFRTSHIEEIQRVLARLDGRSVAMLKLKYLGVRGKLISGKITYVSGFLPAIAIGLIEDEIKRFLLVFGLAELRDEDLSLVDAFVFSIFRTKFTDAPHSQIMEIHKSTEELNHLNKNSGGEFFKRAVERYIGRTGASPHAKGVHDV
jgi:hypothetical protein